MSGRPAQEIRAVGSAGASEDATKADTGKPRGAPETLRRWPVRTLLPEYLPRERVMIPAPSAFPCCGGELAKQGESRNN